MTKKNTAIKMFEEAGFEVLTFDWTNNHKYLWNGISLIKTEAINDEYVSRMQVDIVDLRHDDEVNDWYIQAVEITKWFNGQKESVPGNLTTSELRNIMKVIDYLEK